VQSPSAPAEDTDRGSPEAVRVTMSSLVVPDLSVRHRQAELMDDPDLEPDRHHRALTALARVNRVSFAASRVWHEIAARGTEIDRPVRVLDVACGGGDLLIEVGRMADRAHVPVDLVGCDLSRLALGRAEEESEGRIRTLRVDALSEQLPDADVVTTNLFLHHLDEDDAVSLMERMAASARHVLLVQDLRRTRLGYVFAWIGLHTLTGSDVARVDGLRSVRAAFTVEEVGGLAARAKLENATIRRVWPQRFVLRWSRAA